MGIGDIIKHFRKLNNLTQKQLGEKTNSSDVRIRQYELGTRNAKDDILKKIGSALNINYKYLKNPKYPYTEEDILQILFKSEEQINISPTDKNSIVFKNEKLSKGLKDWKNMQDKVNNNIISLEEYEHWKANYKI